MSFCVYLKIDFDLQAGNSKLNLQRETLLHYPSRISAATPTWRNAGIGDSGRLLFALVI
jgi:hypothetical protein